MALTKVIDGLANRLYFAQHGLALNKTENPDRPLSEAGVKHTHTIAKQLLDAGISVSRIFHSGKLRTVQTADIFTTDLSIQPATATEHLSPNDDVSLLTQNLTIDNALYVGHLPHLEKLVAYLVTGNENDSIIKFQNSAVICLEKSDKHYQLRWYLTPELL